MKFHLRHDNEGIKHGFLCINIRWALRVVLKPEREKRVFGHT